MSADASAMPSTCKLTYRCLCSTEMVVEVDQRDVWLDGEMYQICFRISMSFNDRFRLYRVHMASAMHNVHAELKLPISVQIREVLLQALVQLCAYPEVPLHSKLHGALIIPRHLASGMHEVVPHLLPSQPVSNGMVCLR